MVVGEWIVHVISFQKILGSCGLNGHIMEIRLGVTLEDNDGQRNVKIGLEFWTQNSQKAILPRTFTHPQKQII